MFDLWVWEDDGHTTQYFYEKTEKEQLLERIVELVNEGRSFRLVNA